MYTYCKLGSLGPFYLLNKLLLSLLRYSPKARRMIFVAVNK